MWHLSKFGRFRGINIFYLAVASHDIENIIKLDVNRDFHSKYLSLPDDVMTTSENIQIILEAEQYVTKWMKLIERVSYS